MKAKLGPNVVLRLKFSQSSQGEMIGDGKGYEMVATNDDTDNVALEMINVNADDSAVTIQEADATPLMTEDIAGESCPAEPRADPEIVAENANE